MVCVADIATHRQTQQLTHEMIFKPGADDLPLVVQILRPNEADDAVHEERAESACDSVRSCFERELIDSMMRLSGQGAALTRLEVHHIVPNPSGIPLPMMRMNALAAVPQHVQRNSEAAIGGFCACDRLKKKVYRRPAIEGGQLSSDVG